MQIIVKTPRLIVREFLPAEENLLVDLYKDERLLRYIINRTDDETRQRFQEALSEYQNGSGLSRWGVFDSLNGDFIGVCMLKPADSDPRSIELGYVLAHKYWGIGLATELAKALVSYGFEQKKLKAICAVTHPENTSSQNVLEKAGLVRKGHVFWHGSDLAFFKIENRNY